MKDTIKQGRFIETLRKWSSLSSRGLAIACNRELPIQELSQEILSLFTANKVLGSIVVLDDTFHILFEFRTMYRMKPISPIVGTTYAPPIARLLVSGEIYHDFPNLKNLLQTMNSRHEEIRLLVVEPHQWNEPTCSLLNQIPEKIPFERVNVEDILKIEPVLQDYFRRSSYPLVVAWAAIILNSGELKKYE